MSFFHQMEIEIFLKGDGVIMISWKTTGNDPSFNLLETPKI